jgi:hypothetical protein
MDEPLEFAARQVPIKGQEHGFGVAFEPGNFCPLWECERHSAEFAAISASGLKPRLKSIGFYMRKRPGHTRALGRNRTSRPKMVTSAL